jgi:hypothetical protein
VRVKPGRYAQTRHSRYDRSNAVRKRVQARAARAKAHTGAGCAR